MVMQPRVARYELPWETVCDKTGNAELEFSHSKANRAFAFELGYVHPIL